MLTSENSEFILKNQFNYQIIARQWDYLSWEKEQHGIKEIIPPLEQGRITEIIPLLGIISVIPPCSYEGIISVIPCCSFSPVK